MYISILQLQSYNYFDRNNKQMFGRGNLFVCPHNSICIEYVAKNTRNI